MTDTSWLLSDHRGAPTESAETDGRYGLLRRRRVIFGWTVHAYVPATENDLANMSMPDNTWSADQVRGWRQAYDRLEAKVRPAQLGEFLSEDGTVWKIDREGRLIQ